jgi:hypothetical protein
VPLSETTDDRRPTTDDRRPTTDDRRPTTGESVTEPPMHADTRYTHEWLGMTDARLAGSPVSLQRRFLFAPRSFLPSLRLSH